MTTKEMLDAAMKALYKEPESHYSVYRIRAWCLAHFTYEAPTVEEIRAYVKTQYHTMYVREAWI